MFAWFKRYRLGVVVATAVLLSLFLYWPTLRLPLMFDTLLHIRLVKGMTWGSMWLPSTEFGFYRPLVFLPFLVIKPLFGHYPSALLHGLNVLQHSLNVLLVATLAWRLWQQWSRALVAGLWLACYPFAFQAVISFGNNVYPTGAGLLLLGLHMYLSAIRAQQPRRWWVATALCFVVGILSHETVVLFGVMAMLVHWVVVNRITIRDWPRLLEQPRLLWQQAPFLLFIALAAEYVLLYQFLPTGLGPQLDFGGNALLGKVLYLVQTAVYPVAWLAHRLPMLSAPLVVGLGVAVMLVLTLLAARGAQNRMSLLLGWGWWGMASLLIGVTLPTYYILHGARLAYLGGVGVALLWAVLLDGLFTLPRVGPWLWGGVVTAVTVTSALFVQGRVQAFATIAEPLTVVNQVMAEQPADAGIVLINLPAWTSPVRNTYAVGVEYATMMGSHLFAEELISENIGGERAVLATGVPDLLTDPGYPYGIHQQGSLATNLPTGETHFFVSRYAATGIETTYTGALVALTGAETALATFGPYRLLDATAMWCESGVQTRLLWQTSASDAPLATLSIFVQLLAEDGRLLAQADGPPLNLRPDQLSWPIGWGVVDKRLLVPQESGQLMTLLVGVYDFATGQRLPAQDAEQTPLPDNAFRLPLVNCKGGDD